MIIGADSGTPNHLKFKTIPAWSAEQHGVRFEEG